MSKSFIKRMSPNLPRHKLIEWPFPTEDGSRPKLRVKVLGQNELEASYLATVEHFRKKKIKVDSNDQAFVLRERIENIWRAYEEPDSKEPLAETVDDLASEPLELLGPLYREWNLFHSEMTAGPANAEEMQAVIDELKKNTLPVQLSVWPSTWLIALSSTLANQLANSTPASGAGL